MVKNALCCWHCFLHASVEICLIWEQCSQKWLNPPCPPSRCNPTASVARGRAVGLCCGLQGGGFLGLQSSETLPGSAAPCGALGGLSHPAARRGNTSSCSWQLDVSLGSSSKSLFCFWFLFCLDCPGFSGRLWSLLQMLLVGHAPWLPSPSHGFSSCFLLPLQLRIF